MNNIGYKSNHNVIVILFSSLIQITFVISLFASVPLDYENLVPSELGINDNQSFLNWEFEMILLILSFKTNFSTCCTYRAIMP